MGMNIAKALKQAEKLTSYGNIEEARALYQEVLEENPQNTAVHQLVADLYLQSGQNIPACRHLSRLSELLLAQREVQPAINCLQQVITLLPKNIPAREKLLDIYRQIGSFRDIQSMLQELYSFHEREGNFPKMRDCLKQLCEIDPINEVFPWKLANLQKQSGLKEEAVQSFTRLGEVYYGKEKWNEAIRCFEELSVLNPQDKPNTFRLAQLYEKTGQIPKAINLLVPLLKQGPVGSDLLSYLARLCVETGRLDEAERLYAELLKRQPETDKDLLPFIEVLVKRNKSQQAFAYIEKYFKTIPDKQARQKIIAFLERIIQLEPANLEPYHFLEKLLTAAFQYERLSRVMFAHAELRIQRKEFAKALDLLRHCIDLEPYNKEYRAGLERLETLIKSGDRPKDPSPGSRKTGNPAEENEGFDNYGKPQADRNFTIVSDEDVENFIVDIELLEKFGQHGSAIQRLEEVIRRYPLELGLRNKLKTLYLDRQLPKKAALECLEIAKILQQQDHKEEANRYIREAQRLNPVLSSTRPAAASSSSKEAPTPGVAVDLKGNLSEIGLLDIIQLLDNAQKSGRLALRSEGKPGVIFFNSGRMVNAEFLDKKGEEAIYALVAIKGGTFEYNSSPEPFPVVIKESNTNLLLEGLRLLDEANRDQLESTPEDEPEPPPPPSRKAAPNTILRADVGTVPSPLRSGFELHESEPLDDF